MRSFNFALFSTLSYSILVIYRCRIRTFSVSFVYGLEKRRTQCYLLEYIKNVFFSNSGHSADKFQIHIVTVSTAYTRQTHGKTIRGNRN